MSDLVRCLWLLVLALALSACGSKTPQLPRLGTGDVIVAFGGLTGSLLMQYRHRVGRLETKGRPRSA